MVVLVPPLLMPSFGMLPLRRRLDRQGFVTRLFSYPSYRYDIPSNAARLARYLRSFGAGPLDVVTFSLGGVLLRWAVNHDEVPRLANVVMIGPPNQGVWIASQLDRRIGPAFPLLFGAAARQLRAGDEGLAARAGRLPEETRLGIIAGGTGTHRGFNSLIPGDNDRVVRVEETHLEGMDDFRLVRAPHGPLVFSAETAALAGRFLHGGSFAAEPVSAPTAEAHPATP